MIEAEREDSRSAAGQQGPTLRRMERYAPAVRRAVALVVLIVAWLAPVQVRAMPTSKLVYSRSVDADSCPDEQVLRRAVAARVGYDPFFAYATRTIVASLARRGQAFAATVDLIDEGGVSHGARELRAEGDCGELLEAVALAIAIAIDPQSLSRPASAALAPALDEPTAPPPSPAVVVIPPRPTSDAAAIPPSSPPSEASMAPWSFDVSAGLAGSVGFAPGPSAGLSLGADARWRWVSLGLEGRVDAPASTSGSAGGTVTSWLVLGAIVPCAHLGSFFGCALVQAGSAQTSGSGVPDARTQSLPWLAAGGRIGAHVRMTDDTLLRLHADLVANLDPMTLQLYGGDVWPAPAVAASLGADVVLHFR